MYVYVQDINGNPIMPTKRLGKVRHLLKDRKAKVVKRTPFTIRLTYQSKTFTQPITLGVDAGSKTIGLSATTEEDELFASNVVLRTDIVELLSSRRALRRGRRSRKTRYRKARFDNRTHVKHKGWLAPSVEQKINTHFKVIADTHKLLPISKIIVETASFDIQKIKDDAISGYEYQQGEQLGFWNVREYVLFRDGHTCQHCKGKSKDKVLNIHHIESRKTGGNAPNNLITLCETCHKAYHKGKIELNVKRGSSFRDSSFMGIMRWTVYNRLKAIYPDVSMTYGYITKNSRIENSLEKDHCIDARCISGHPSAKPLDCWYSQKAVRRHNRQIHKPTISKGGYRKANQAPKYVFGFQLFDKVRLPDGRTGFVFGRRTSGSFDIRTLDGNRLSAGISYKKLSTIEKRRTILTERRMRRLYVDARWYSPKA